MKKMRLDKLVANNGFATRKEVRKLIKQGIITVDGVKNEDIVPEMKVSPSKDKVRVHGEVIEQVGDIFAMMYKPKGVITTLFDSKGHETVMDYLPPELWYMNLFPVGNLPQEAEGLVLFLNDSALGHRLAHPKKNIKRTYYAEVAGNITNKDIMKFRKGFQFPTYFCENVDMTIVEKSDTATVVHISLIERKTYQLLDMFEKIEKSVNWLQAVSIANVFLDDNIQVGDMRILSENEIEKLKNV